MDIAPEKMDIFNEKKGFICDMDGVIYHGNRILPGVAEFIQWLHDEKKEYLFLTNNSGYTPLEPLHLLFRAGGVCRRSRRGALCAAQPAAGCRGALHGRVLRSGAHG